MYQKILVPLDGSQLSEGILPYARIFAKALEIPVELLNVIDSVTFMPTTVDHDRYHAMLVAEREKNADYLRKVALLFSDASSVDCTVEVGNPPEVIVDKAAASRDTLIAVATHGRSGVKRWFLGSVADKVLHAASNDLLLVRTPEEATTIEAVALKSVFVPLDGSPLAESAMARAVELAKKMDLEVILLRISSFPTVYFVEGYTPDMGEIWDQIREEAEDYLREKIGQLQREGVKRVSMLAAEGHPAEKIIDLVQKKPQSLVAMCTHGRTGVGRWVLGSVTERVVRYSGDPVLVVRASTKSEPFA